MVQASAIRGMDFSERSPNHPCYWLKTRLVCHELRRMQIGGVQLLDALMYAAKDANQSIDVINQSRNAALVSWRIKTASEVEYQNTDSADATIARLVATARALADQQENTHVD